MVSLPLHGDWTYDFTGKSGTVSWSSLATLQGCSFISASLTIRNNGNWNSSTDSVSISGTGTSKLTFNFRTTNSWNNSQSFGVSGIMCKHNLKYGINESLNVASTIQI